jgi:hypothetical protein
MHPVGPVTGMGPFKGSLLTCPTPDTLICMWQLMQAHTLTSAQQIYVLTAACSFCPVSTTLMNAPAHQVRRMLTVSVHVEGGGGRPEL